VTNIVFSDTEVWTQSFALAGDVFFHFSHTCSTKELVFCLFFHFGFFCGITTQGLHLKALHQPIFGMGFFKTRPNELFAWSLFWTVIFLISASWVARITGVSHKYSAVTSI
jgi:hypothetical protein